MWRYNRDKTRVSLSCYVGVAVDCVCVFFGRIHNAPFAFGLTVNMRVEPFRICQKKKKKNCTLNAHDNSCTTFGKIKMLKRQTFLTFSVLGKWKHLINYTTFNGFAQNAQYKDGMFIKYFRPFYLFQLRLPFAHQFNNLHRYELLMVFNNITYSSWCLAKFR